MQTDAGTRVNNDLYRQFTTRALLICLATAIAVVTSLLLHAPSARAYEYNTAAGTSTVITYPSGLTATFSASGQTSMTAANTHAVSNASAAMFSPNSIPVATTVSEVSTDMNGCTTVANATATCSRGTLTLTFNRPVTNPQINISGLGGAGTVPCSGFGCSTGTALYAMSGTLASSTPAGATLGTLSAGATNMQISGSTWSAVNDRLNNVCDAAGASPRQAVGGCGTVSIVGTVTSVTFNITGRIWADKAGTINTSSIEAVRLSVSPRQDFSDGPATYNPTQAPAHAISNLKLGSTIDEDQATTLNPTTSSLAVAAAGNANGANGDGSDEDAVASWPALTTAMTGTNYVVAVPISGASAAGRVCGWVDFNRGGTFDNTSERACTDFLSGATTVNLTWAVPAAATTAGITYARLRASYNTTQVQSPTGVADSGEVEDYTLAIMPTIKVIKTLSSSFSDTFNLLVNGTTVASAVGNGGTSGNKTAFDNSTYGTPDLTVAANVASAVVPLTITEAATGLNARTYTTAYSCVNGAAVNVGTGTGTSISLNIPQSTGTNAQAQTITCTFTNTMQPAVPVVSSPTNGSSITDTTPTFSGTGDTGATITVYDGLSVVCTAVVDGLGNWTCDASGIQSQGVHSYTAKATFGANSSALTSPISLTIDSIAPTPPVITSPANGSFTTDSTPAVTGTAEANSTVNVYDGAVLVCTTTANGSGNWSCDTSTLVDGSHPLTAKATDTAGNTSTASTGKTITVDTIAPVVVISAPASGSTTGDNTPLITFSVTEANLGTTQCSVDGGAWSACSSGTSLSTLLDGSHTLAVRHTDGAGNVGSSSTTFTVDTSAPAAPVIASPTTGSSTNDSTPTVTGTAEAGSIVKVYDGASLVCTTTANGTGNWTCDTSALADGPHVLTAKATDAVGNESGASNTVNLTVDTAVPAAPVISSPANGSSTSDTTPTVSGTAEAGSTVRVYDGALLVCTTTANGSGNWTCDTSALADGSHALTAKATDAAGNQSGASNTVNLTVDTVAPTAPVITGPADNSSTKDSTPTVTGTAEAGSTVKVYDGASLVCTTTANGTGNWTCDTSALADGPHVITAKAIDAAGNQSGPSNTVNLTVDTVAPAAPVIAVPLSGRFSSDNTPTVSGTAEANTTVKVYDGASLVCTTTANGSGDWTCDTSVLTDGLHVLTAKSTDAATNQSGPSNAVNLTVDTAAPVVLISAPANASTTSDSTPPIAFTVTDTNLGNSQCSVDGGAWVACVSGDSLAALLDGSHTLAVRNTDDADNVGSASTTFTVDSTAPAAPAISSPVSGSSTNDTTPTITGTAEAGSTVKVYDGASLVCTTTANGTGNWTCDTSALADGSHPLTAKATDAAGNQSGPSNTVNLTVDTVAPAAPVISSPASGSSTNDSTPTVSGTAEAGSTVKVYDGASLVCTTTADGAGNWTCDTSALADGPHALTAKATDDAGNQSGPSNTVNLTVDTIAPSAPVITGPADNSSTNDSTPTVTGTAEAGSTVKVYDGATLVCTIIANGTGNWTCDTSALADGPHVLTAKATDPVGNTGPASSATHLTIDTTTPAVQIATPANGSSTNDNTPPIAFTVTDANLGSTECRVDVGAWLACSSGDSLAPLSDGTHTLSVRHTDAANNVGSASTTFSVDSTAPSAPVTTAPTAGATLADSTPTFKGTAEPGSSVKIYVDGNFIGTATTDPGGNWTLDSPVALSDGPHAVTATATDAAGNTSPASTAVNFSIDTTPPGLVVTPQPVANPADSPTFDIGVSDPAAVTTCSLDGATFFACSTSYMPPALEPGTHTLVVKAVDPQGNVTERTLTFVIGADKVQCPSAAATEGIPAKVNVLGVRKQRTKLRFDFSTDKFVLAQIILTNGTKKVGNSTRAGNAGNRSIFMRVRGLPKSNAKLTVTMNTITEDGGRTQVKASLMVDAKGNFALAPLSARNGGKIVGTPCGADARAPKVKLDADSDTKIAGFKRIKFRAKANQLSVMTVLIQQNGKLLGRKVFVLTAGKRIIKPVKFMNGQQLKKGAFTVTFNIYAITGKKVVKIRKMQAR
ncbi:MAG: hypothetical protein JHC87_02920 [Thermoleophilaceae bacterium]|nr:hypothetical protein [Thermoleophilaceae bacterium]